MRRRPAALWITALLAAIDNAVNDRALQRDFARDPISWAAHTYLTLEHMSQP